MTTPTGFSDYANGRRFLRESSHDRTYKEQLNFLLHEFLPVTKAACGVSLRLVRVSLQPGTSHTMGGRQHTNPLSFSMLCRSVYAQRGHGHRFRSVCFPAFHVLHRTFHPLSWDSRGKNTVALVFLALVSPPLGIRKALKDCSLKARFHSAFR